MLVSSEATPAGMAWWQRGFCRKIVFPLGPTILPIEYGTQCTPLFASVA
jgi:hypothetical protein